MAWRYCEKCGEGMSYPTVDQVLEPENYQCLECDTENDPQVTIKDLIRNLLERVEALEVTAGVRSIDGY